MQPHIILLMNKEKYFNFPNGSYMGTDVHGIDYSELIESHPEEGILIFKDFETAKKHQDDNALDGRVVPLPIY